VGAGNAAGALQVRVRRSPHGPLVDLYTRRQVSGPGPSRWPDLAGRYAQRGAHTLAAAATRQRGVDAHQPRRRVARGLLRGWACPGMGPATARTAFRTRAL